MKLIVISYKECWACQDSESGFATIGGFPIQMKIISELFDETTLMLPIKNSSLPDGAMPLSGKNLKITPLNDPPGKGLIRKITLCYWLPQHINTLWREVKKADAIHSPVPGDIGTIGILIALAQRKRLFVRHCGTWGNKTTIADRFLNWLLPKIAGEINVVMATGGGDFPPCLENEHISWIFSSSVYEDEWAYTSLAKPWHRGETLKLVTVSRLDPGKNTEAAIKALPIVQKYYKETILHVVGDGPCRKGLESLTQDLGVADFVKFHGRLNHDSVMKVLANSNIFVFPTNVKEGFPKVLVEAFTCGLPVISSSVSVIPYLIGKDKGVVLNNTAYKTVADAIIRILKDEGRLAQMSLNARQTSKHFTLEKWQEIIENRLTDAWGPLIYREVD
jgi:glycosyltransferase involved in cell wall biosynthesis